MIAARDVAVEIIDEAMALGAQLDADEGRARLRFLKAEVAALTTRLTAALVTHKDGGQELGP